MATIRDVARLAEVSVSTVSLALSNPGRVSQKTLERIRTAVAAVGYVADPLAQILNVFTTVVAELLVVSHTVKVCSPMAQLFDPLEATVALYVPAFATSAYGEPGSAAFVGSTALTA